MTELSEPVEISVQGFAYVISAMAPAPADGRAWQYWVRVMAAVRAAIEQAVTTQRAAEAGGDAERALASNQRNLAQVVTSLQENPSALTLLWPPDWPFPVPYPFPWPPGPGPDPIAETGALPGMLLLVIGAEFANVASLLDDSDSGTGIDSDTGGIEASPAAALAPALSHHAAALFAAGLLRLDSKHKPGHGVALA